MSALRRARGALLGLACGDALGRPVEFHTPDRIEREHGRVTDMLGHGTHGQPPGTITDDTEMALCIARSLADRGRFDPADVAARFVEWYEGEPFDIGLMTADALRRIDAGSSWEEAGREVWERRPEGQNAGNGSVMRCVPHALAFADDHETLVEVSRQSSAITHADPRCTCGCAILNCTVAGLIEGEDAPLANALSRLDGEIPDELQSAVQAVPDAIDESELTASGYVVDTLQTGLYHGLTADSAEEAIVEAVNMGEDTDTVGAVTGTVAGARFGSDSLPDRWVAELDCAAELQSLATALYENSFES